MKRFLLTVVLAATCLIESRAQSITFTPLPSTTKYAWAPAGYNPYSTDLQLADFNGDGKLDLATTYFNNANNIGSNSHRISVVVTYNHDGSVLGDMIGYGPNTRDVQSGDLRGNGGGIIRIADVDGDGDPDILTAGTADHIHGGLRLLINGGGYGSGSTWSWIIPGVASTLYKPGGPFYEGTYDAKFAMLNNDSRPDLVFIENAYVHVAFNTGSSGWFEPSDKVSYALSGITKEVECADIDHDGDIDILVGSTTKFVIFINNGNKTFTERASVNLTKTAKSFILKDFNNDGYADLVVANDADMEVYLNTSGNFGSSPNSTLVTPTGFGSLNVVDLNGDGKLDLAGKKSLYGTVCFFGTGTGTFSAGTTYPPTGVLTSKVRFGDLDNDGLIDQTSASIEDNMYIYTYLQGADVTLPTVSTFSPADNATNVGIGSNLVLTFSEPIQKGTGSITIKRSSDNGTIQTIDVTSGAVTLSGSTVTINPATDLPAGTGLYINVANTAIKDLANNNFAGISNNSTWNFTTAAAADVTAPMLNSFTPANNATNIYANTNFYLYFNEPVQIGSGKNIYIKRSTDNVTVKTITTASSNIWVTAANPNAIEIEQFYEGEELFGGQTYFVLIESGFFTDLSGNAHAGISNNASWRFTTNQLYNPPYYSALSPADNSTNVVPSSDLVMTFSEDVQPGISGAIEIRRVSDNSVIENIPVNSSRVQFSNSTVTINPGSNLPNATAMYVHIDEGAIRDMTNNMFSGISTASQWNFTTGMLDVTAPIVSSFYPAAGATDVAIDIGELRIVFDEPVQKAHPGNIILRDFSNAIIVQYYPAAGDSRVTVTGNTVTIALPQNLPFGTSFYVQVTPGTFEDHAGNDYAGNMGTNWSFSTTAAPDTNVPVVQSLSPADNATGVSLSADLQLVFNEPMKKGSGDIVLRKASDNTIVQTIPVSSGSVTISGTTVTVNPNDFPGGTELYVTVTSGAFRDLADNNFAGISAATTWNFTTIKQTQTITFAALPAKTFGDAPFAISATASSGLPVTFVSNNPAVASVSGSMVTIHSAGTVIITASQAGNAQYEAAVSVPRQFVINPATQTITFNALPAQTFGDTPFTLTAAASSGLPVSFASSNPSIASVAGNEVTIHGAGTITITATQAGNTNYQSATAVPRSLTINKANQLITFDALPEKAVGDAPFTLQASTSSGLTIAYASSNPAVATVSGSTVTIVGNGTTNITATQTGNANYLAATPVVRPLTVSSVTRIISMPATLDFGRVIIGQSVSKILTIENSGNQDLTISSITLPSAVTAQPQSGTVPAGSTFDVVLTFEPLTEQSFSETLVIQSDATSGTPSVELIGSAVLITAVENPLSDVRPYPNPARESLTITGKSDVTLLDATGRPVQVIVTETREPDLRMINIGHLPRGMYVLIEHYRGHTRTTKILKAE